MFIYHLLETNFVTEQVIRLVIRNMLSYKLTMELKNSPEQQQKLLMDLAKDLKLSPIAIETNSANEQHYELPTDFFRLILGPNLKYSCALWTPSAMSLEQAEENMLSLYCQRAEIKNGQTILDLGCGWGSMSLYLAKNYPQAKITALSNSVTQKAHIEGECVRQNLNNLKVITANIVDFESENKYDRIISIEMFEHMKNFELLLQKLKRWLKSNGKLFVHIFSHKTYAYAFDDKNDWLAKHFFSGGIMPSNQLLLYFQRDLRVVNHWLVNGLNYQKTADFWLKNMKANKKAIMPILVTTYGEKQAMRWWIYWQLFFIACSETFGYERGSQWMVSHYLFE